MTKSDIKEQIPNTVTPDDNVKTTINSSSNNNSNQQEYEYATRGQVNGAALMGGLAGMLLGGPILGGLAAGISACLAATDDGKAGDFVRKGGTMAVNVGKKFQKEEQERHILDTTADKLHLEEGVEWIEQKFSSYSPCSSPKSSSTMGEEKDEKQNT
jgi:hypothetical protein